jgi:DNA polymerase I-like protein with 3'-5' exonuclease and polymerase domains
MLDTNFQFSLPEAFNKRDPYDLVLKKCSNWKTSAKRVLVVLQTVDGRDLKAEELLGDRAVNTAFRSALNYSKKLAQAYKSDVADPAYAVANYHAFKSLHLKGGGRAEAEAAFATRVQDIIKKLKPTHVLISGDQAMKSIFPQVNNSEFKRGWVHKLQVGDVAVKVTSTLDFARLLEKGGAAANLLGFWCRHFSYLLLGANPHNISHIKPSARYVDTIEKFDKLMQRFDDAEFCAIDTETKNLSVLHNKIYTIQFATNHNEEVGYVLAVDHPLAHWTLEDRKYIKRELRKRFASKKGPILVTFNGMFDLRVIRRCLKIPIIWLKVWEIMYGEQGLDDNLSDLSSQGVKVGNLAATLCSYVNDFYYTKEGFSKADRSTTGTVDPRDRGFLEYGSMDVVALLAMRHQQLARASRMRMGDQNFKPYFVRHMLHQMSDTAHQLSHLREDGSKISRSYLKHLLSTDSPLTAELKRTEGEFRVFKEVQQANKELLAESGFKAGSLFASASPSWAFSLGKAAHKQKLFVNILGLPALTKTKGGADQIDAAYIDFYKDKNKVVSLYGDHQKLSKLKSTYVKGFYKRLTGNLDGATDDHLRADYEIITTGRSASKNPNLQNIVNRGRLAKIIKRMFIAPNGHLLIRYDYSAHEVRLWSIIANDKVLAAAFKAGQALRKAFIQNPTAENKDAIKKKGDIHILNVLRFFGKLVDKDDPLRDAVKAVVFGTLYGKGAESLGEDTKQAELGELKGKISALYNESLVSKDKKRFVEINHMLEELDIKLTALLQEDRTSYAQGIIDKMFTEFPAGARWTQKMGDSAENEYCVFSPIGRRRYLPAALTKDRAIVAKQVRRGSNAPVQGMASEVGVKAGRLIYKAYYQNLKTFKEKLGITTKDWELRIPFNRSVHDANYYAVPYAMIIPFIHVLQFQATYGVTKAYKDEFNIAFTVEPEIEIECAARDDQSYKWDWSIPNLVDNLKKAVHDAHELGVLTGTEEQVMKEILKPWRRAEIRKYLQQEFPLLNVRDLDKQILEAVK